MDLKNYISETYPVVGPFEGANSADSRLLKYGYLVVLSEEKEYLGILIPSDRIIHPHKIVIDCITKKERILINDSVSTALLKFQKNESVALPIFSEDNTFLGVIEKSHVICCLELKVKEFYDKSLISLKAKTFFLNNLSHEIRTPLNIILGFMEIIEDLDGTIAADPEKPYSSILRQSSKQFLLTMDDLIEVSLLHSDASVKAVKREINLKELFDELSAHFDDSLYAQDRGVSIVFPDIDNSLVINSDKNKLAKILIHLLDNAIKFSQTDKVFLNYRLCKEENSIEFLVTNEGIEIPPDDRTVIFDIFKKQEYIGENFNHGLGLGLPLAKGFAELLGGQVKVESANNKTTFFVKIPIR